MKITIVNFSGRENGNCKQIAEVIGNEFKEQEVYIIDFNQVNLFQCSNCNYECFNNKNDCPYIVDDCNEIYEQILNSDLLFYVIPNYCGYPCSNFFMFNERGCCVFNGDKELLNKIFDENQIDAHIQIQHDAAMLESAETYGEI